MFSGKTKKRLVFIISLAITLYGLSMVAKNYINSYQNQNEYQQLSNLYHNYKSPSNANAVNIPANTEKNNDMLNLGSSPTNTAKVTNTQKPSSTPKTTAKPSSTLTPAKQGNSSVSGNAGSKTTNNNTTSKATPKLTPKATPKLTPAKTPEPTQTPIPARIPAALQRDAFDNLLKINKDIKGWIQIPNTNIDYPIVQFTNNSYYLNHDYFNKLNKFGMIFADCRTNINNMDNNTIIYGHNNIEGIMFSALTKFQDRKFFDENRYFSFDTLYASYKCEIFNVFVTDTSFYYLDTSFADYKEFSEYVNSCMNKSLYSRKVDINENDKIITLSTCKLGVENTRIVVQAKLENY